MAVRKAWTRSKVAGIVEKYSLARKINKSKVQNKEDYKMPENIYPKKLTITNNIANGLFVLKDEGTYWDTTDAIKITVEIDSSKYPKEEVSKSINEVFQIISRYFC